MIFIGIDPGLDGAIAALNEAAPQEPQIWDAPTLLAGVASKGGKARREYDEQGMRSILQLARGSDDVDVEVLLEKQGPMPGQAAQATFSQAKGYGLWRGLLAGLQIPYRLVTPQAWKKALMPGEPRTVEASVLAAARYYPKARQMLVGPRGGLKDGRADALLLARYGMVVQ